MLRRYLGGDDIGDGHLALLQEAPVHLFVGIGYAQGLEHVCVLRPLDV
ncbi:hypothetical protein GCM10010330_76250 [Streptomyces tendae]|nr:hypothetical protein GCM10010330_76250 [Streptomyces tendae]